LDDEAELSADRASHFVSVDRLTPHQMDIVLRDLLAASLHYKQHAERFASYVFDRLAFYSEGHPERTLQEILDIAKADHDKSTPA
jgi:hypothetical protein